MKHILFRALVALVLAVGVVSPMGIASAEDTIPTSEGHDHNRTGGNRAVLEESSYPFSGDRGVRTGLILAISIVTKQSRNAVLTDLNSGLSISQIAAAGGSSDAAVLAQYDAQVAKVFNSRAESGELPQSVADSRITWFQNAARRMIDQPGLTPAYPGLHELHVVAIAAAAKVAGMRYGAVTSQLLTCRTVNDVLADNNHTGHEAVDLAMVTIDGWLDELESEGELSADQKQEWRGSIAGALGNMMNASGLHVAGKACAK